MNNEKKSFERPKWLVNFRKQTELIDVIDLAYSENCECNVCQRLRKVAIDLGELFMGTRRR